MNPNTWEFVRRDDGTDAVVRRGEVVSDSIPEKWLEQTLCERYGFCAEECKHIVKELADYGTCTLVL